MKVKGGTITLRYDSEAKSLASKFMQSQNRDLTFTARMKVNTKNLS